MFVEETSCLAEESAASPTGPSKDQERLLTLLPAGSWQLPVSGWGQSSSRTTCTPVWKCAFKSLWNAGTSAASRYCNGEGCGCVLGVSFSNLDGILILCQTNSNFVPLLIFQHVCFLICVIISSIRPASPPSSWHRPNNYQTDAFSSGMPLNSFLTDRAILIFIHFLTGDPGPSKAVWFSFSALKLCACQCCSAHTCSVFVSEAVLVQVVGLLFSTCCGVITSAHGTGARRRVWGGSDSVKATQRELSK